MMDKYFLILLFNGVRLSETPMVHCYVILMNLTFIINARKTKTCTCKNTKLMGLHYLKSIDYFRDTLTQNPGPKEDPFFLHDCMNILKQVIVPFYYTLEQWFHVHIYDTNDNLILVFWIHILYTIYICLVKAKYYFIYHFLIQLKMYSELLYR